MKMIDTPPFFKTTPTNFTNPSLIMGKIWTPATKPFSNKDLPEKTENSESHIIDYRVW